MPDHLLLAGAVLSNIAGFAWLALAMDAHWQQVHGAGRPPQGRRVPLRFAAGVAFLISFLLCNLSDHVTIAALVWVMALTAGALLVAFALTWRPVLLRPLSWWGGRAPKARAEPMNRPSAFNRYVPSATSADTGFHECSEAEAIEHRAAEPDGSDAHIASPPLAAPGWRPSGRYADQPMNWSTRLFGLGGVVTIVLAIVGTALFTWRIYAAPPAAATLSVFDVAPPAAPPEPPSEIPPRPEQKERPLSVPDRPTIDPPEIRLPTVNPLPPPAAQPVPDPGPPIERTTVPERPPAPSAPQQSIGKPTWEGLVLAALNKAKRYPRQAQRARQQGVPYIRFVMDREGRVLSVSLERSSGFEALDEAAAVLPKRASPLPKPPDGVGAETIELVVPVEFFIR